MGLFDYICSINKICDMETTKQFLNRVISELNFSLEPINYDYCNVIQSCGTNNNIPTMHKTKGGDVKLYGNVNLTLRKVADLDITLTVEIGVNVKKKGRRTWDFKHEVVVPNVKLDVNNIENVKTYIWEQVRAYRKHSLTL